MCGRLYNFPRGLVLYWVALASGFHFFHPQNFINLSCQLCVQFWKGRAMPGHGFINTITDRITSLQQINKPKYNFHLINVIVNCFVIYFLEFHLYDSNQFSFFFRLWKNTAWNLHGRACFAYDENAACCCQLQALHHQICNFWELKENQHYICIYIYCISTGYDFQ